MSDSLRPSLDWAAESKQFGQQIGHQVFLCLICVHQGDETPKTQMVVHDGQSLCLTHFRNPHDR